MPGDSPKDHPTGESAVQGQSAPEVPLVPTSPPVQETSVASPDRAELLTRAQTFLTSPQVRLQDLEAKRAFLAEKGLTPSEIDQLFRELPPSVPPRTYPAAPPSSLPNLLIGVARIFTWLTGTSAIVFLVYYKYLLPRLAQSYQARFALRKHQSVLIARLTESASTLKVAQAESYKDIPQTVPVYEDPQYAQCHTVDDLLSHVVSTREDLTRPGADIPDITILRCALEELGCSKTDGTPTEVIFRHLESKLLWLGGEEGAARQSDLWNQLNASRLFMSTVPKAVAADPLPLDHPSRLLWKYVPPPLPTTSPLFASLENLRASLPRDQEAAKAGPLPVLTISARQRTLQVLSDFTGYITAQTYSFGISSIRGTGGVIPGGNPIEDELRREIRALKGLVLNRRSFLPSNAGVSGFVSDIPGSS